MAGPLFKSSQGSFYIPGWVVGKLSVMDRYIATELTMPFLFGMGMFSSVGVAIGTLFDLMRKITEFGLPLSLALKVLALKMPEFIGYAFPMSTLLAALMTYSRFSSDSELVALRSSGISFYRLVTPAIVLSFFVTGLTFTFNQAIVPRANFEAANTLQNALWNKDIPSYQEKNILYQEFQKTKEGEASQTLSRLFYSREFDGRQMRGLTILDFSEKDLNQIITADTATWNPDRNSWDFFDGTIYVVAADASYRNIIKFQRQELQISRAPLDLATKGRDYAQMNIAESEAYLELLLQSGDEQKIRRLMVEIQRKYALPFVCVVFGLGGAILGIRPQRTSKATGFGISVLIIFGYYLLSTVCGTFGDTGVLSPFLAGWLPNILGLATVSAMLVRVNR